MQRAERGDLAAERIGAAELPGADNMGVRLESWIYGRFAANSEGREMTPFRIEPNFTARVWGFRDLRPWYDRVAEGDPIGEVWLTGDDCLVATGPHAGKRLGALFSEEHEALLGADAPAPDSPLLIKTIFAREKLSVQVHPDDKMAQKYGEPRGKTECWYALAAEPGAKVAVGVKPGTTLGEIEEGIRAGTLEASLNMLPVAAGDMIFVDAGTVHSIWPGSILLETQQNCDLTYRMYDYGRARELHIEKSLEATKLTTRAGKVAPRRARRPHGADRCGVLSHGANSRERQPDERKPARRRREARAGLSVCGCGSGAAGG